MLTKNERWMAAAIALSERGRALTAPNPNVGCVIAKEGRVIGRGWTQAGGRPHAEAMALEAAGEGARGATAYVTLEPCAHQSERGPACADSLIAAGIVKGVIALTDPDPRTNGKGIERLRAAGIAVETGILEAEARRAMAGWLSGIERGRPFVTLKLATSLDGCIALASGESRWITGEAARAHAHLERARSNMILVGRGTYDTDQPKLDVRLTGLEDRSPERAILSADGGFARHDDDDWRVISNPQDVLNLHQTHYFLIEGGAQTAAAFLKAGLVDRLLLYRAPIIIGRGKASLGDIGLDALDAAHGAWHRSDTRQLGSDTLEVYERL
jgi:diaminohydroxyphosphoribosylaminopyrimidine deaminase / 5-amino-6-(5-phosphoribosylamino)uracil reductase